MSQRKDIIGAVLAGGASSRMGVDKATLSIAGTPMISRVAGALSEVFFDVILLPGGNEGYPNLQFPHVPDVFEGCGPLGGIHAALAHASPKPVFIVACDLPFVTPSLIIHLLSDPSSAHVKLPSIDGRMQPLCGLYAAECLPVFEARLRKGWYGVSRAVAELQHSITPIDHHLPFYFPHILSNINSSEEYHSIPGSENQDRNL